MDAYKLSLIGSRLFNYEVRPFLIGVSSGQITSEIDSEEWHDLKKKAQNNHVSDVELRKMVELCGYEKLGLLYELMDELGK
ncbi:hypothetical protein LGV68_05465 [Vibrio sp. LQ2]|uniref:hypothetical protein n=1 Tax=Vibrio TaxID=662 RepID=UPI00208E5924|nr:hypothetical protein [Vibrio sp. LQ2]USP06751.1 hypothetical protein LGV68_05465 [Vibrio sp. LQ2]